MHTVQHQIEIFADVEQAFDICRDVERWPQLFPPCRAAKVLTQEENKQLIEISAQANGRLFTWRSQRELNEATKVITFHQVQPSPLLSRMEGAWRFFPIEQGTLIALEHRFAVKDDVAGLVPGVESADEALKFMTRSTDVNSRRELRAIKRVLEGQARRDGKENLRADFEEELMIAAPTAEIYRLLKDAAGWPALLPHCEAIRMLYDDGTNQEFIMTVKVNGKDEIIRSIRHCVDSRRISYFQPEPPPVLRSHTGQWLVESLGNESIVISQHEIELDPEGVERLWGRIELAQARDKVVNAINSNSKSTMLALEKALCAGAAQ